MQITTGSKNLTDNGNYVTQWGSQGSGNGQFYDPEGIAVDSSGNVYVVDTSGTLMFRNLIRRELI
jgi:DNA-binding beta-propeller fold protein YncE